MKIMFFLLCIVAASASAQTTTQKWPVYGTYKDPVILITTDNANLILSIDKTTNKTWIKKSTLPGFSIVHDSVYRDPVKTSEYIALKASYDALRAQNTANLQVNAQTIIERDEARKERDSEIAKRLAKEKEFATFIVQYKQLRDEMRKWKVIQIMVPKDSL